jgi:hypothetical protein
MQVMRFDELRNWTFHKGAKIVKIFGMLRTFERN